MTLRTKSLLLTLLSLFILFGCDDPAETTSRTTLPTVEVQVETLVLHEAPSRIELAGTLRAVEQATISAQVSGQAVKLPVKLGSRVDKGDLLVQIAASEMKARVQQADAQLAQAQRNLDREAKLLRVNASTRETVNTLEEQVRIYQAARSEARAMLDYTEIRAPFAGVVTDKRIELGDLATPGLPLLRLENVKNLEVVIQVPEAQSHFLDLDGRLPLAVPATGQSLEAQVKEISPRVDPASRTTQVKLVLPGDPGLRSGQFVRVTLPDRPTKTLLIRRSSLRQKGQMQQVFVAEQDVARMRLVRIGADIEGQVEILSGLKAGDRVILDPPANLRDGQPLLIADGNER